MQHPPPEPESDDAFVRRVLPAFDVQASPDFQRNVFARIDALAASRRRRARWNTPAWVPWLTPAVAAAALVLSTLTFWVNGPWAPEWARPPAETGNSGLRDSALARGLDKTPYALIQEGERAMEVGDTAQAMQAYQEAVNQIALPLNQLAWLAYQQGEAAKGLAWARLAVQLQPEEADYLHTLAVLLCTVGEREDALRTMEQAAQLQPHLFGAKLARLRQGACQ